MFGTSTPWFMVMRTSFCCDCWLTDPPPDCFMTSGSGFTTRTGHVCRPPVLLCGLGSVRSVYRMCPHPCNTHRRCLQPSRGTESSRPSTSPQQAGRQAGGTRQRECRQELRGCPFLLISAVNFPNLPQNFRKPRRLRATPTRVSLPGNGSIHSCS